MVPCFLCAPTRAIRPCNHACLFGLELTAAGIADMFGNDTFGQLMDLRLVLSLEAFFTNADKWFQPQLTVED